MNKEEQILIDDNSYQGLPVYMAHTLGGLIYQRMQHKAEELTENKDDYQAKFEIKYLNALMNLEQTNQEAAEMSSVSAMWACDSGILFDMWAHVVNVARATHDMDDTFCPAHFAKGVHEHICIMFYG